MRERVVKSRTALVNQIRGLLMEYGIVVTQWVMQIRKQFPFIIQDAKNELTDFVRPLFNELLCELRDVEEKVKAYDKKIDRRGFNRTVVALANKNARVMWAIMAKGEIYKAA